MAQATLVGVLTIHLVGILYMLFIAALQRENFDMIFGWIAAQSGSKILYDLLFGFIDRTPTTTSFYWQIVMIGTVGILELINHLKIRI